MQSVKIVFDYERGLLLSSIVEVVGGDVICVPLHSVNGKFFFGWGWGVRRAPFLWCMWSIIQSNE